MRVDEIKFLHQMVKGELIPILKGGLGLEVLIDHIRAYHVRLQMRRKEPTEILSLENIEKIRKTIPSLRRIVDKPRSFIRSTEEKIPVETAKRINYKAMALLSRDSNDWHARTYLAVKPKRILSDLNEESVDLYENRVVVTLIDRIFDHVKKRRSELEKVTNRMVERSAEKYIEQSLTQYRGFSNDGNVLLKAMRKSDDLPDELSGDEKTRLDTVRSLEKKIKQLKQSKFYHNLRKCRRESDPIQKTNLFIFDHDYGACFKLWNEMNLMSKEEIDLQLNDEELSLKDRFYQIYCLVVVISAIANMGFECPGDSRLFFDGNEIALSPKAVFSKNGDLLSLHVEKNSAKEPLFVLSFSTEDDRKNGKQEVFTIQTDYTDFEKSTAVEVDRKTTELVRELRLPARKRSSDRKKSNDLTGRYAFVSLDMYACSENNDFDETTYRRFYNIGDNYSPEETGIERLSGYQTGLQIISPDDCDLNWRRIARLINSRILRRKGLETFKGECPKCGNSKPTVRSKDEVICHECGHLMSRSSCKNCGQEFLWIKFIKENILCDERLTEEILDLANKPLHFKLQLYESLMGPHVITSFMLEKENVHAPWKSKTVCPHCGKKLGETG